MDIRDFDISPMTKVLLAETRRQWLDKIPGNAAEELIPMAEKKLEMYASWIQKEVQDEGEENPSYYALRIKETNEVVAIIQLTDARKGKDPSYKLLSLYFDPISNLEFREENIPQTEDIKRISIILLAAIAKSVGYAFRRETRFKMFLRTSETAVMFETILSLQNGEPSLYSVYRQGCWLVIDSK